MEEQLSSATFFRNLPRYKVVWMESEMQILRFHLVGQKYLNLYENNRSDNYVHLESNLSLIGELRVVNVNDAKHYRHSNEVSMLNCVFFWR